MSDPFFEQTVFPDEMGELRARRETVQQPTEQLQDWPTVDNELVGLAISGGGVRSASFALGAVQVLARTGLLERVDYLSTVSGGGFLGSSISALLHAESVGATRDHFPLGHPPGKAEPPALAHVRSFTDYLAPDGTLDRLRIPALLLSGLLVNMAIWLPLLLLFAAGTDMAHHLYTARGGAPFIGLLVRLAIGGFALFGIMALARPAVSQILGRHLHWSLRNTQSRLLGISFFGAVAMLAIVPLLGLAISAVETDLSRTAPEIVEIAASLEASEAQMANSPWAQLVRHVVVPLRTELFISAIIATLVGLFGLWKFLTSFKDQLRAMAFQSLGLLGPGVLYLSYLIVCVVAVGAGAENGSRVVGGRAHAAIRDSVFQGSTQEPFVILGVAGLVLGLLVMVFYNVNLTSLHRFYRDRLSKAWLISHSGPLGRTDQPQHVDGLRLSQLRCPGSPAPYHLIQAAANTSHHDARLHGKAAAFFEFSKHWVGGKVTGWCSTERMERLDKYLDLGTAMAVSGAAAAPQMGTETIRPLAFLLAMLNVRMGYWIPHPGRSREAGRLRRARLRFGPGPRYMLREATGSASLDTPFVYISDGGHIENLGVYGLIRRRCRLVIAIDGEEDPRVHCTSLMELVRYARMDEGIEIEIDISELHRDEHGISKRNWALGTIHYSDTDKGVLLYLKSTITGGEPQDLLDYRRRFAAFPHDSTTDQFFDPPRFEAYRALGHHVAATALARCGGDPSDTSWVPGAIGRDLEASSD